MTRNTKIVLWVLVAAVIILCLCAWLMVFTVGAWFINRTVTIGTDTVHLPVDNASATAQHQLRVDGRELAASILLTGWR